MMTFLKALFCDESGKPSNARVGSMICTATGVFSILIGFILIGCGIKGVETYVGIVLGATMTKGASDLWASQIKSGKVLAAKAIAAPTPATPTPPKTGGTP